MTENVTYCDKHVSSGKCIFFSVNILKGYKPVKQTLRRFSEPKRQAMGEELAKLIEAGFIREIKHPDWLANLVMVPKKDKYWHLCVNFKDLNTACPKDPFPLPRIDQIIDATAGHDSLLHTAPSVSTPCLSGSKRWRHLPTHDPNMPGEANRQDS